MAHCAKIEEGKVVQVIVTDDMYGDLTCEEWCEQTYGGTWKQTSYNTKHGVHKLGGAPLRKNYAGIGYTYDETLDAFILPKTKESFVLNTEKGIYEPPTQKPDDGKSYEWDEGSLSWKEIVLPEEIVQARQ